jgi:hypothetical protein
MDSTGVSVGAIFWQPSKHGECFYCRVGGWFLVHIALYTVYTELALVCCPSILDWLGAEYSRQDEWW